MESIHRAPEFLPGGKDVLFLASQGATSKLVAQSLTTGMRRDLLQMGTDGARYAPITAYAYDTAYLYDMAYLNLLQGVSLIRYAPPGYLVYGQGLNVMAVAFDSQKLSVTGPAVPVIENVLPFQFSFSATGSLVYVPGSGGGIGLRLVWVDRKGAEQSVNAPPHNYVLPRISPDGKRVAAGIEETDSQIWLYDLNRDTLTRLTFEGNFNVDPVWTPDGKRIVFKGGRNRFYWQLADGSEGAEELTKSPLGPNNVPASFSPDGQMFAFAEINPSTGYALYTLSLKDGKPQLLSRTPTMEASPRFSPDGHFIAYASNESGRIEIYVRQYPGPGRKWQISTEGGSEPAWNPKGGELFYRSGNKMMAVKVTTQGEFSAGRPKVLFEGHYVPSPLTSTDYDVSPDGQRFLMLKSSEEGQAGPMQINVVLNWFEELKQKVPTGKK